jgi:hypothetical protein
MISVGDAEFRGINTIGLRFITAVDIATHRVKLTTVSGLIGGTMLAFSVFLNVRMEDSTLLCRKDALACGGLS